MPTLKDNDFLTDGGKINVGADVKKDLMDRLTKDVEVGALFWSQVYWDHLIGSAVKSE